jgi:hypothetical protein
MLSRFLDRHRAVWEKDYLWIKLDQRWTGAEEIAKRLRQQAWKAEDGKVRQAQGIPWTAILDADGKVMASSTNEQGANIGFPGEAANIAHFRQMLRATAQRLTDADIARLADALKTPGN